jgi:iron complex transport system substrate-binding protein
MNTVYHRFLLFLMAILTAIAISSCNAHLLDSATVNASMPTSDCRMIQHALGETCVPQNPQRIIVLDEMSLEIALVLGFKPVGASLWREKFPPYLQEKTNGIEVVSKSDQPNLEKILLLKPDLILSVSSYTEQAVYDQLSHIAPVVECQWYDGKVVRWKECFQFIAEVLDKSSEAKIITNDYDQRVAELSQALGVGAASPKENRLQPIEVSLVRIYSDRIRLRGEGQHICSIVIQDVGLSRSPIQKKGIDISIENIEYADGDVIFIQRHPQSNNYQYITNHPLWLRLNAVQAGNVYEVGDDYWHGSSYIAANLILDDLFKYLVK